LGSWVAEDLGKNIIGRSCHSSLQSLIWSLCLVYLWRKVVCLFCSYEIHQTRMLQIVFLVSLESSWRVGLQRLGSMTFGLSSAKVLEYWMIFSLKIKLNRSWNFKRNWKVPLVFDGKISMSRILWNLFGKIWIQNVGDTDFKWFLPLKIQINSKKPGFERKNHLRTW